MEAVMGHAARIVRRLAPTGSGYHLLRYLELLGIDEETTVDHEQGQQASEPVVYEVAADVGNARTVVLVRQPSGDVVEVKMPSAKSVRGASSYRLFAHRDLAPDSWSALARHEHIITRDGMEAFIGALAVESAGLAETARGSDQRYHDGWIADFIMAGVAAALPRVSEITIRLATTVPAELWSTIYQKVATSLQDTYRYEYNGRQVVLRIIEVQVYREGQVAYKALPEGKREGRTLIIDGGGRTFNIVPLLNGSANGIMAKTLELGVEGVLDDLDEDLIREGHRGLTLYERIGLQEAMREKRPFSIVVNNAEVRIDERAARRFARATRELVQLLRAKIKLDMANNVWLIGGWVYFMGESMVQLVPVARAADEPETRNAYGALIELAGSPVKKGRRR